MNPNGNTIAKLLKIKDQEKNLKATGKKTPYYILQKKQYKWLLISYQKLQSSESNRNKNKIEKMSTLNSKSRKYPSEILMSPLKFAP